MAVSVAAVTTDCADALVVGGFWSAALERPLDDGASSAFASIGMPAHRDPEGWTISRDEHPTWLFVQVLEPKVAKNRMHVDVAATDHEAEIVRLVGLGATRVTDMDEFGYRWTVMHDPEGNEFCVAHLREKS